MESIDWGQIVYALIIAVLPVFLRMLPNGEQWAKGFEKIKPLLEKILETLKKKGNNTQVENKSTSNPSKEDSNNGKSD